MYRCAGTVVAAEAEVVGGPGLLAVLAVLAVLRVLRVHDGSLAASGVFETGCATGIPKGDVMGCFGIAPMSPVADCLGLEFRQQHVRHTCNIEHPLLARAFIYFATDAGPISKYGRNQAPRTAPLIGRNDWVGASGKGGEGSEWVEFQRQVV